MKKILFITGIILIFFSSTIFAYPNYNMSWDFKIFNDPDARQVAINTAQKQADLTETEEDPIDQFADGLERRLYSSAQRQIIDMIMGEEDIPYGDFEAGDLQISVAEDPQTGEVLVEITDTISGDSTVITYSDDDWSSDLNY